MTSKQVRGPSKNWHPASEGTLKTDIQQVRGPSKLTSGKWGDPQNWHCASEGTLKTDIQQVRGPSKLTSCKWGDPILTSSKWGDAILSRIKICRDLRTFWRSLGKKSAFLWNKKKWLYFPFNIGLRIGKCAFVLSKNKDWWICNCGCAKELIMRETTTVARWE